MTDNELVRERLSSVPVRELHDLGEGVCVSQTPLWQTNAVLARSGDEAPLCDPSFTPEEIERLATLAREGGGEIHAAAIGAEDLAYLAALAHAVAEARDFSPSRELLHVYEVEPPRATTPDFEIYARSVLAHA